MEFTHFEILWHIVFPDVSDQDQVPLQLQYFAKYHYHAIGTVKAAAIANKKRTDINAAGCRMMLNFAKN